MTGELRSVLSQLVGRTIPATEKVDDVAPELQRVADELEVHRRLASAANAWQFSDVPELVAQVIDSRGRRVQARLAGGDRRADFDDPMQRAYARMLLRVAIDHLDATEPTSTTGAVQ